MSPKLKKIIFDKLYQDLKHVEIIPYKDSIWFIDREKKYWYFEYEKTGLLWWRYKFLIDFFRLFSLEQNDFKPIISEWVEEVLNCKVYRTKYEHVWFTGPVEEVLNCKVDRTGIDIEEGKNAVEEVLNCKVDRTSNHDIHQIHRVEEALNCKVDSASGNYGISASAVEEVLNYKVNTTQTAYRFPTTQVEEVLNSK